ncbi:MAG: FHA domain-containing protein [Anaerolineae bacterium]
MMQGSDSFRLIVRRGPQPNQSYELNKDIVTLGRDITNDIVINDPEVSRHHMRLTRGAGGFTIEDLGSTNGTFINGQRLTGARPLRAGDMVGLGETVTLAYEMSAGGQEPGIEAPGGTAVSPAQRSPQYPAQAPQYSYTPQQRAPVQQSPHQQQQPAQQSPYGQPPQAPAPRYQCPAATRASTTYAAREEELRNTTCWIPIGCAGLALFCCCSTVLGLVFIDQACLGISCRSSTTLRALGYTAVCS